MGIKRSAYETELELPASSSSSAKRQSPFAADLISTHPPGSEVEEIVWLDNSDESESGDDDNLQPPASSVIDVDSVAATCEAPAKERAASKLINKPPVLDELMNLGNQSCQHFPAHNLVKRDGLSRPNGTNCIHGLSIQLVRMQHSVSVVGCFLFLAVPC